MKVVHIIFNLCLGGTETMLLDIMDCQVRQGHDVSLVLINRGHNDTLLSKVNKQIKVVAINRPIGSKNPWYLFKLNYALARLSPDIVHVHNDKTMGMVLKRKGVKYVGTVHCIGLNIPNIHKWDKIFAISNAVKEDIKQRYNRDATIVYNGVKPDSFEKKQNISDSGKIFKIIQVGRLDHAVKGQDITINAVSRLREKYGIDNVSVDFFGSGPSLEWLQELVKECNLENCISISGSVDREKLCTILKEYDLLIQPSRNEGFGLTVVEGMAAKVPVLVSRNDGPIEVIDNGRYGAYFENGDVDDCARRIMEMMTHYNQYYDLAQNEAYQRAVNDFDIEKTTERYIRVYAECI